MSHAPHFPGWSEAVLARYAAYPSRSRGRAHGEAESAHRTVFQRDRDRIIHSTAFRRLKHKTQVFVYHEGDHFRTRLTHSIEVSQIARTIARALGLSEDLAEALSLAHDLGHAPFGHAGEDVLNEKMATFGGFDHNVQTLRIIAKLEKRYPEFDGLNLSWEVREGLAKHNGPVPEHSAVARALADFGAGWQIPLSGHASAEAQVAALADDIAYDNHDIDDGLRAGLFGLDDLHYVPFLAEIVEDVQRGLADHPLSVRINEVVRRSIGLMVEDVLTESQRRLDELAPKDCDAIRAHPAPVIAFSVALSAQEAELKRFLRSTMYRHHLVVRAIGKGKKVVSDLFDLYLADPATLPPDWQGHIATADQSRHARAVADYIAGMTDRFALQDHRKLFDMTTLSP